MNAEKKKIHSYIVEDKLQIEEIIEEYNNYIYKIIKNMSSKISNEDIEEIILDVFLTLWQNKNKLDINKSMSSYIAGITRNVVKLKFRKIKNQENIDDFENIFSESNDLEFNILEDEKRQIIRMELDKIKSIDREIFVEYYYKENNIKQISNLFQMSETRIKSKLFRVRKKLKKALRERGYDKIE